MATKIEVPWCVVLTGKSLGVLLKSSNLRIIYHPYKHKIGYAVHYRGAGPGWTAVFRLGGVRAKDFVYRPRVPGVPGCRLPCLSQFQWCGVSHAPAFP